MEIIVGNRTKEGFIGSTYAAVCLAEGQESRAGERGSPEDAAERKSCPRGEPENLNGAAHTAD